MWYTGVLGASWSIYIRKQERGPREESIKMADDAGIVELELTEQKRQPSNSGIKNFFAGGFGGVCCIATGHPLDTIKVNTYILFPRSNDYT